jgi:hypothetical protein
MGAKITFGLKSVICVTVFHVELCRFFCHLFAAFPWESESQNRLAHIAER